ncbi:tRNA lysidine(34) synthetase TilS [Blautia sp. MSJ-19]|uniref:tRNA lysidine(34) synthetase TilS n=1 Tax=Blautia sp. MSJ-19 TaxID=2841517 RepID=UPI001C0F2AE6|nr:tRNA lysidine(34) synthetase TilS [Blautia sp. MSJ-19]MBU5479648.1 tRNA lysidine(34) synthetase TilS [Blautia sp. MSJ-19]
MQKSILQKTEEYIRETEMLQSCSLVIAGVSGGPDSMAMLDILNRLSETMQFMVRVVHVNHGIRGEEALRDQETVQRFCTALGITCSVYTYDVPKLAAQWKTGTEETGRILRRRAFEEEKRKTAVPRERIRIALAHNKNDLAETMLHHLARGSGLRGLSSLKPVNGEWIRPVLCLERCEIVDYVKEKGIPCVTDSSNLEDTYTRNRIRRHILPLLEKEVNEKTVTHMAEAARIFDQAEAYFTELAKREAENYSVEEKKYTLDSAFFEKKEILQDYVIREILEQTGGHQKDLTGNHIRQIRELHHCQVGKRIQLPYGMEARRCYEGVQISLGEREKCRDGRATEEDTVLLDMTGETAWKNKKFHVRIFSYTGEKILEKKYTKWFDCDKIKCELSVRTRRSGDYMVIDQAGSHKKLRRCMIDDKIPAELRETIPLVAAGDEILWIVGGRINERYKITSWTGRVLEITYQGGNVQ